MLFRVPFQVLATAMLGLLAESAKSPYENFLKDRLAIREMVDADCETYNIPMDL